MKSPVDFTSQEYLRDPSAGLQTLRNAGPLVQIKFPIIGQVWVTTTYEAAANILKDSQQFTLRKDGTGVAGLRWWMPGIIRTLANNMLTMDEPDHTRLRKIVDEAFRRRAVLEMEPQVRTLAERFAGTLFDQGTPADLVDRYSRMVPLYVISELLGLPEDDRAQFASWTKTFTRIRSALDFLRVAPAIWSIRKYIEKRIAYVRKHGGEGLIADLVRIEKEGGQISSSEMVAMVFLLLGAGSETTTHVIGGAAYELLKTPELAAWLKEDWGRADLAIEEFLRVISAVQFSKPRHVRVDCEVAGTKLKKGDLVMTMIAAANYDPAANDKPELFDPARRPNRHLAFGTGIHFCLGHQLARLEAKTALEVLFTRWPDLSLAVPADSVRWSKRPGMRAIASLPVKPSAAA